MPLKGAWLCVVFVALGPLAAAQNPPGDPLHGLLFPPELLVHHRDRIGLRDQQVDQIRARTEDVAAQTKQLQQQLTKAIGELASMLSDARIDEAAALKQHDQVLALEKQVKRLHLRMLIQIRNQLSAEQRQVATTLVQQQAQPAAHDKQRLQRKISRIEQEILRLANLGQPPFEAVGKMQKFPELMQQGQVRQAEALLDDVLKMLGLDRPEGAQQVPQAAPDPGARPDPDQKSGRSPRPAAGGLGADVESLVRLSADEIRAQVAALKKDDVAWRKIEWKSCLLEGLAASRDENKPVMLWIFIDRPVDDERC